MVINSNTSSEECREGLLNCARHVGGNHLHCRESLNCTHPKVDSAVVWVDVTFNHIQVCRPWKQIRILCCDYIHTCKYAYWHLFIQPKWCIMLTTLFCDQLRKSYITLPDHCWCLELSHELLAWDNFCVYVSFLALCLILIVLFFSAHTKVIKLHFLLLVESHLKVDRQTSHPREPDNQHLWGIHECKENDGWKQTCWQRQIFLMKYQMLWWEFRLNFLMIWEVS